MAPRPQRLNREFVLMSAVELADVHGIDGVSMRSLADLLGVVPMALYKHVANKEDLLGGMIDTVIAEIPAQRKGSRSWKSAVRTRVLDTRATLNRHPWARRVIESRTTRTATVLSHLDSIAALLLAGGLSPKLTHHAMHAIGSRVWGFSQDVFDDHEREHSVPDYASVNALRTVYPSLADVAIAVLHDNGKMYEGSCNEQFEFEFALDILLDGIDAAHKLRKVR